MKKVCILILLCLIVRVGYAQQSLHLVLYDVTSAQVIIPLSDLPILTFSSDSLKIKTDNVVLQFPMSELTRFAYEQRGNSTGSLSPLIGDDINIENNILLLHTNPGERVFLYTISGIVMADYVANQSGDISIPLFSLADGIYVLQYNDIALKFKK